MLWLLAIGGFLAWVAPLLDCALVRWRPMRLGEVPSDAGVAWPRLSVIVPALNEEETIGDAMRTLMALDYPDLEVIAVNDRSTDRTGAILDALAQEHSQLRVAHVDSLPHGWLGKNHAMHIGSKMASGEYLLFTDADVHFSPSALCRAVHYARAKRLDHLTLFPDVPVEGFWAQSATSFFGVMFMNFLRPWRVPDPGSKAHLGIGAFNLVRAAAYRAMGGHASLPMDVADDVKLGKRFKESGGRAEILIGTGMVSVKWVNGVTGLVRGLTKNAFAGLSYSVPMACLAMFGVAMMGLWPVFGAAIGPHGARLLCRGSLTMMLVFGSVVRTSSRASRFAGVGYPLAACVLCYIILRSMCITLWQGGVVWRGTLYPLDQLRRNLV